MDFTIKEYPQLQFGTVYCIGRNYAKHISEMKSEQTEDPVVFLKPRSSILFNNQSIKIPEQSLNVHHEVELVLLIGHKVKDCSLEESLQMIKAFAVGIDVTARDLQTEAKKGGLPWVLSKGFNTFAPIGNFVEYNSKTNLGNLDIKVKVNGKIRQDGNSSDMIFSPAELICYLSHQFTLYPGDLIFTGTPEGVSPIINGDVIEASVGEKLSNLKVYVQS